MIIRLIFILQVLFFIVSAEKIRIGSIFAPDVSSLIPVEENAEATEEAPKVKTKFHEFEIENTLFKTPYDILKITDKVCGMFEDQIVTVFGRLDPPSLIHLESICDEMEIPLIKFQEDFYDNTVEKPINLYPTVDAIGKIIDSIIEALKWKQFSLVFDSTNSLIKMSRTLNRFNSVDLTVKFYRVDGTPDDRQVLKRIKESGDTNLVIDCSFDILEDLLFKCLQVGVISDRFSIFITSMDLHTIDLESYQYMDVNMTGIKFITGTVTPEIVKIIKRNKMEPFDEDAEAELESYQLKTEDALYYDGLLLFTEAFRRLKHATKIHTKPLTCDTSNSWEHGMSLSNFIKSVQIEGLSGLVNFDNEGHRTDFEVEIFKLTSTGIKTIGKWNETKNVEWINMEPSESEPNSLSLRNTTFKVLIALTKPYGMLKETVFKMSGNDQYEGFAIDIIHEISKMLGFNYTFHVQEDNVYGSLNPETGMWNGMLRRVMDNEADLAITDLTITAERETAVDFTMPFMNLGISILYQKPKAAPPSLMSFLLPFSINVWLYLIGVYLVVSMLFFILGRMNADEWNNPYPCIEDPEELSNQFTIKNSLWFCIGALMQQGSEIAPAGNSTRMLAGCWWFFCLIIVSSYTANLAAFLTVETVERPIKNAEDLANQDVIEYGAKKGGSTLGFFKDSNTTTYSTMYEYMMKNADRVLTSDNDQGKKKVLTENYAFLMESSSIEYIQERECNLTQIGGLLDAKGYGIAMRKNASYRNELSGAVLKLQEMGILTSLKNKWWKEKGGGGRCQESEGGGQADELGLANVGGVFLVLVLGVVLSAILAFSEFMYETIVNNKSNLTTWEKVKQEMEFILKFGEDSKPARVDQQE